MDETLILKEVVAVIREFGFPVFVCLFLMYMYKRATDQLAEAHRANLDAQNRMLDKLDTVLSGQNRLEGAVETAIDLFEEQSKSGSHVATHLSIRETPASVPAPHDGASLPGTATVPAVTAGEKERA